MLLSIIAHLVMVILILVAPKWFPWLTEPRRVQVVARQAQQEPPLQYMMVAPRVERPVQKPPERALPSDLNRAAASPERAKKPENMRAVLARQHARARRRAAAPDRRADRGRSPIPAAGRPAENPQPDPSQKIPESQSALQMPSNRTPSQNGANGRSATSGGSLGDALRNLQRYTQNEAFDNQGGGGGSSAPRFSSTPRASSSARGSAASSRRSSATGSSRTRRCR